MGALNYNLKKLNHPDRNKRAELLETNFSSLNPSQVKREVEWIRQLRPNLNRYVYHTSLNFSKEEQTGLSNEKLSAIAQDYLTENGFTNNQYFVFRHYDADHPHLHLLVNRIRFDGSVVSDSNNYKKSEAILRAIELRYNLNPVIGSKHSVQRAATKGELEKTMRTDSPSDKMVLQELMNGLLKERNLTISGFIKKAEKKGIHLLFNQASTGKISGITYFYNDFKIKGQALGNRFKWAELIKQINYDQDRDSKAISEANSRTKGIYGDYIKSAGQQATGEYQGYRNGGDGFYTGSSENSHDNRQQSANVDKPGAEDRPGRERTLEADQDVNILADDSPDFDYNRFDSIDIEITDDEDDAKYRRRSRGMGR
jgi:hypothetical protein